VNRIRESFMNRKTGSLKPERQGCIVLTLPFC
jgi:hypothetical protein